MSKKIITLLIIAALAFPMSVSAKKDDNHSNNPHAATDNRHPAKVPHSIITLQKCSLKRLHF